MEKSTSRLKVLAILVALMFAALTTRLWFLQVLALAASAERRSTASRRGSSRRTRPAAASSTTVIDRWS